MKMYNNKLLLFIFSIALVGAVGCKKELDIINPNSPTLAAANTETGIVAIAKGGIYVNGFRDLKYSDGVFGYFWSGAMGFHELMGDVIGAEAANAYLNQIGCPDKVIFSSSVSMENPASPNTFSQFLATVNNNQYQGENFIYYEWAYMYNMISVANSLLEKADAIEFSGNKAAKVATLKAWAYYWKGYAYAHLGSIYKAGLINDESFKTTSVYVTNTKIIEESNRMLDLAAAELDKASAGTADYESLIAKLIPTDFQVGKGGAPSIASWKKSINTLKARSILVNTTLASMTAGQWQSIITLASGGIGADDNIFTVRNNATGDLFSSSFCVANRIQSTAPGGGGYKLSERWVQEFDPADKRYVNNVKTGETWIGNVDRGNSYNTRYTLHNGGNGVDGVKVYADNGAGALELNIAGSYEENQLMLAEAKINTGDITGGLAHIQNVRDAQGAGLATLVGQTLSATQAKEVLRKERRIALAFTGLSFYDARRNGYNVSRSGVIAIDANGVVYNNATINYGFLPYWPVPDNELAYNPAAAGSADVK